MRITAAMTATSDHIFTLLVDNQTAIRRQNRSDSDDMFLTKQGCIGSERCEDSNSAKRDKKHNQVNTTEKDQQKCFRCQWGVHIAENWLSNQCGNPPKAPDTTVQSWTKALTVTTSSLTTSFVNNLMAASSNALWNDWFLDCRCTIYISGHQSIFISYTNYPPTMRKVMDSNRVISFASGYGSVRLICQLPDGMMEITILHAVVLLFELFNRISQSQSTVKDINVEPVEHYTPTHYNRPSKLIATAP